MRRPSGDTGVVRGDARDDVGCDARGGALVVWGTVRSRIVALIDSPVRRLVQTCWALLGIPLVRTER